MVARKGSDTQIQEQIRGLGLLRWHNSGQAHKRSPAGDMRVTRIWPQQCVTHRRRKFRWLACLCLLLCGYGVPADELGLRVPVGFKVALYADDELAHDIYCMTIDSLGRVVVSGAGYVRILIDSDEDGRADTSTAPPAARRECSLTGVT